MTALEGPHRFVPGDDPRAPLLLALHGTGGDENDVVPLAQRLVPGAPVLAPRGGVVEADGVPRFFRRIPAAPGDGGLSPAYPFAFDEEEVVGRAGELAGFVEQARSHYGEPHRPLVATGFSNGANMAAVLLLVRPDLPRAAVLFAPMPVLSAPPRPDLRAVAAFLGTGRDDAIATPELVERLAATLADAGAAVEVHVGDGGHQVHPSVLGPAVDWVAKLRLALGTDPGGLP